MRILYVANDIAYWRAHRTGMARKIAAAGHDVALLCGVAGGGGGGADLGRRFDRNRHLAPLQGGEEIIPGGRVWTVPLDPQRLTPGADLRLTRAIHAAATAFQPDVVHLLTLKPILYGALALRRARDCRVVATFAGLGRVFAVDPPDARLRWLSRALTFAFDRGGLTAVFENTADRDRLVAAAIVPADRTAVVAGAGFDADDFPPAPMPPGPGEAAPLRALFASRLLYSKGLGTVLDVTRHLPAGMRVEVTVAGAAGNDPDAVPPDLLQQCALAGAIDFRGAVRPQDMARLIAAHHVVLLPTVYPEGTPRILSEAASVGRPSIVSDHAGCTAFVRDGLDGIVLGRPEPAHLARALRHLVDRPDLLTAMGLSARRRALGAFTTDHVAAAYLTIYAG